jgi:predicted DNA repair protein MutK
MPSGFFALLDDISVLAKASLATIDDVALGASRTAVKTSGVIVDDIAVAPQLVTGLSPKRELPVIWKITKGSLRNKFLIVIPLLMLLSWLLPAALPYLLVIGGSYLAFEGAEKFLLMVKLLKGHKEERLAANSSEELEKKMVTSAVTTDLVLSTEIMLISLSSIDIDNWISKLLMLSIVAIGLTALVYGVVGLLIKVDDIGLHMARRKGRGVRLFGLGLLQAMPGVFKTLSVVGTFAMLWVGGHLVWKSLGDIGIEIFSHSLHGLEEFFHHYHGIIAWFGETLASTAFGILWGVLIFLPVHFIGAAIAKRRGTAAH